MEEEDDAFFSALPTRQIRDNSSGEAYNLPSRDGLDDAAELASERLVQLGIVAVGGSSTVDEDDDEFSFSSDPPLVHSPPKVPEKQNTPSLSACHPVATTYTQSSLVSEAAAIDALQAVRASLAESAAKERKQEMAEMESKVQATSLLQAPKKEGPLTAFSEVEEGEEEEEEDNVAEIHPGNGNEIASVSAPDSIREDGEAAALEAAFEKATLLAMAEVASSSSSHSQSAPVHGGPTSSAAPSSMPNVVTLCEAESALLEPRALAPFHSGITPEVIDSSIGCFGRLFLTKFPAQHIAARDALFACARRPYDPSAPLQTALMAHLYSVITGLSSSSPGASWTTIGFQREGDFSTDLRGVGMLGPLQVLSLYANHPRVAATLWSLATSTLHPFPFMIHCLSLTAKTLHALRLGKLNKCVAGLGAAKPAVVVGSEAVWRLVHDWFAGLSLDFCCEWRRDPSANINRIGHIVQRVVDAGYASPEGVLSRLIAFEEKKK